VLEGRARHIRLLALAGMVVTLAVVLLGCGRAESGGDAAKSSAATQTNEGGEVTVAVTWKGPSAGERTSGTSSSPGLDRTLMPARPELEVSFLN